MATEDFFDDATEQSIVKATIVRKYFMAWAQVILSWGKEKIAYINLFAGPGRYDDGTKSTPLLVLEDAINHSELRKKLVTIFNDKDEYNVRSLQAAIQELPGIDTLKHMPQVTSLEIGKEIVQQIGRMSRVPTLFFVDPWGYKGLSLRLIEAALRNDGCECIFFFNYNRIRAGINNPPVQKHMDELFGPERAQQLRQNLAGLSPQECEFSIVEEISQALKQSKQKRQHYVLPFRFVDKHGTRTSHHLIFVSKHFRGYDIMKDIMARESTETTQSVASFEYNPASKRQPLLFELSRPLEYLAEMLLTEFTGQTLSMKEIYERHSIDKPYIKPNYKAVLRELEEAGRIQAVPSLDQRKRGTFADHVKAIFPLDS